MASMHSVLKYAHFRSPTQKTTAASCILLTKARLFIFYYNTMLINDLDKNSISRGI